MSGHGRLLIRYCQLGVLSWWVLKEYLPILYFTGFISGTRSKGLIGDINFKKSYYCESNKKFDLSLNSTENNESIYFTMSAKISEFKIQAFEFNNATSGDYQNCKLYF